MVAKLVIEEGDLKGLTLSLDEGDTWTIGRNPEECQFVIEDPLVSRKHLIVRRTPEGFNVENLSSTNPAQINDVEMKDQPHLLQNGDSIKIGNQVLLYYQDTLAHVIEEEILEPEIEGEPESHEIPETDEISKFDDELSETPDKPESHEPPESEEPEISEFDEIDMNIPVSESKFAPPLTPATTPSLPSSQDQNVPSHGENTLFGDENPENATLAEIDFGVIDSGRWLLKVIGGPNNGAEFYMQAGHDYTLGTDPQSCDIVFHDTSVSRQHARISISAEDNLTIEDLKSRNGVLVSGVPIEGRQPLPQSTIITLGTTSFVVYDREGEMQTIISPLLPSIVKVLQQEPGAKTEEIPSPTPKPEVVEAPTAYSPPIEPIPPRPPRQFGPYIILTAIIGLFTLAAIGTTSLFKAEPVIVQTQENADELIQQAIKPFPAIRYTFNKTSGSILLLGHVATLADKQQLLYNLDNLKFIKSRDDAGIVIDEYASHEVNSMLDENPAWKGIRIHSPAAGQFVLSGYLQTRRQADQLSSYLSLNFPYLDLLKKEIVVEEDVINQINLWLQKAELTDVVPKMVNGEVSLTGTAPAEKANAITEVVDKIKQIPGVRIVNNLVRTQTTETGTIDISDSYHVTGKSRIGNKYTVVINGRILSENDELDGMTITKIAPDRVLLEKDGVKYRIDY